MGNVKKIALSLVLILLCALCGNSALAESRNAFEFYDLYVTRLRTVEEELSVSVMHDIHAGRYEGAEYMNIFAGENEYYVITPAGEMLISMPDFSIVRFEVTMMDLNDSDEEMERDMYRAATAYGALEYGGSEDYLQSVLSKIDPNLTGSFAVGVVEEFADMVNAVFEDESRYLPLLAKSGSTIHFASANYEYTLLYICDDSYNGIPAEFITLVAEAK